MKRLFVALLAGAFACAPLAGLAQDKPAGKSAAPPSSANAPDGKAGDKAPPTAPKKRKAGGC